MQAVMIESMIFNSFLFSRENSTSLSKLSIVKFNLASIVFESLRRERDEAAFRSTTFSDGDR